MQLNKLEYFYADRQTDVCEKENGNVAESWIFFIVPKVAAWLGFPFFMGLFQFS
jgi:hypothetical protein